LGDDHLEARSPPRGIGLSDAGISVTEIGKF